ncbi:MAG: hypothetical protein HUM72_12660 [Dolichospermum sp.]|nr:hypothetical protein [Dolichospermum sp.]
MKRLTVKFQNKIIAQSQGSDDDLSKWLASDCFKYPAGYTVEYLDITDKINQESLNAEAVKYLLNTDWLVIREIETGKQCPPEVKQQRAAARLKVVV